MDKKILVNKDFIVKLQGKEFVMYSGLLDVAHQIGLKELSVELVQIPSESNNYIAICKATAISKQDEVYTDIGDASPTSVNGMVAPHLIRVAATRAKARVLRDLTNIGITALEEVDLEVVSGKSEQKTSDVGDLIGKALGLQNKLISIGKGQELAKITNGKRVDAIKTNSELSSVIKEMEKLLN